MLILPLHRVPGRPVLGLCTLLLVVANVLVYFALQSGDRRVDEAARANYSGSGLMALEAERYARYLGLQGRGQMAAELEALPGPVQVAWLEFHTGLDRGFQGWMRAGEGLPDAEQRARWAAKRQAHDDIRAQSITWRLMHRSGEFNPLRMLSSAFLHGGFGHLLGNMVFLLVIGNLVEAVLGAWRYLLTYALGAIGAGLASLAWWGGEPAAGLGASGAIAGLMGAYCVLWGRRKVRFFYWFFVVFDYVRAPAIVLLPAWLGWELLQMAIDEGSNIAFEAHAGGMVAGALVALALHRWGRLDTARFASTGAAPGQADDEALSLALDHLGRMEGRQAEAVLEPLLQRRPDWLAARVAHYRAARYEGRGQAVAERAARALAVPALDLEGLRSQAAVAREAGGAGIGLPGAVLDGLTGRLVEAGLLEEAASALDADAPGSAPASAWFRLALGFERQGRQEYRTVLERIRRQFPDSPEAGKAGFLLQEA